MEKEDIKRVFKEMNWELPEQHNEEYVAKYNFRDILNVIDLVEMQVKNNCIKSDVKGTSFLDKRTCLTCLMYDNKELLDPCKHCVSVGNTTGEYNTLWTDCL